MLTLRLDLMWTGMCETADCSSSYGSNKPLEYFMALVADATMLCFLMWPPILQSPSSFDVVSPWLITDGCCPLSTGSDQLPGVCFPACGQKSGRGICITPSKPVFTILTWFTAKNSQWSLVQFWDEDSIQKSELSFSVSVFAFSNWNSGQPTPLKTSQRTPKGLEGPYSLHYDMLTG